MYLIQLDEINQFNRGCQGREGVKNKIQLFSWLRAIRSWRLHSYIARVSLSIPSRNRLVTGVDDLKGFQDSSLRPWTLDSIMADISRFLIFFNISFFNERKQPSIQLTKFDSLKNKVFSC